MTLLASLNGFAMTFLKMRAPALKVIAWIIIEAAFVEMLAFMVENADEGFVRMSPRETAAPPVKYAPVSLKVSVAPVIMAQGDEPAIP